MTLYESGILDALQKCILLIVQYENEIEKIHIVNELKTVFCNQLLWINRIPEERKSCLEPLVFDGFIRSIEKSISTVNQILVNYRLINKNGKISIQTLNDYQVIPANSICSMDSILLVLGVKIIRDLNSAPQGIVKYIVIDLAACYLHGPWLDKFTEFLQLIAKESVKIIFFTHARDATILHDKFHEIDKRAVFLLDIKEVEK